MRLRITSVDLYQTECHTRIPFRFGISTLTRAPLCLARVTVDGDARSTGFSSDLMVPKWFQKDPGRSIDDDIRDLAQSALAGGREFMEQPAGSVFELWHGAKTSSHGPTGQDPLVRGFGLALIERALMDAACRAAGVTFFQALRDNLFDFRPRTVHEELADWDWRASLPTQPADSVLVRHTVGLLDPLLATDIDEADRVNDGLPESLDEDIREYGLTYFKVKIGGHHDEDLQRLRRVSQVVRETAGSSSRFTLDGNEQFATLADLHTLLGQLDTDESGRWLLERLLYIEQPLARAVSFEPTATAAMADVTSFAPVIIDEADRDLDSMHSARTHGYRGVSVKNCKGVFRALLNRGICECAEGPMFQCSEDLTNLGVIALQQDLATVAALGLEHTERNGHHYFRGLDHLPAQEAEEAVTAHPDLYAVANRGSRLRIEDGRIRMSSIQTPGYGYNVTVHPEQRTPIASDQQERP